MNTNKDIDSVFEEEITEVELDKVNVDSKGTEIDINDDYKTAREKIMMAIIRSSETLDTATREAKTAPSPRSIEACASISKSLNESTKNLMDLHKEIRGLENSKDKEVADETNKNVKSSLTALLKEINDKEENQANQNLQ